MQIPVADVLGPSVVGDPLGTVISSCLGKEVPLFILHTNDVVETQTTDMIQERRTGKPVV